MPKVRTGGAEKWSRRASGATEEYKAGVANPRTDWAEATQSAENSYNQGVQEAITQKRFSKGVRQAGSQKWRDKATEKGASRFSQGVSLGEQDYASGVAPYLDTISKITLPPRGAKGDPRNLERVKIISDALRKRKLQG